ncbi:hypothetical protein [Streptosporangium sp. NPDC020145]|uniref:hypothetical protein n=1 Tax=Streptosporangium sp. NPDC020145 TaxID=3154694 RepID=UPI003429064D
MPSSGGTLGSTGTGQGDHLSRYIKDYLAREQTSERALAARSRDPVTTLTLKHGWINQLVNNGVERAPELWRLRALAAGMGVPVRVLTELTAAQWLALSVEELPAGEDAVVLINVPEGLTPDQKERFRRMAEGLARQMFD